MSRSFADHAPGQPLHRQDSQSLQKIDGFLRDSCLLRLVAAAAATTTTTTTTASTTADSAHKVWHR
jgi:hypothetical protein